MPLSDRIVVSSFSPPKSQAPNGIIRFRGAFDPRLRDHPPSRPGPGFAPRDCLQLQVVPGRSTRAQQEGVGHTQTLCQVAKWLEGGRHPSLLKGREKANGREIARQCVPCQMGGLACLAHPFASVRAMLFQVHTARDPWWSYAGCFRMSNVASPVAFSSTLLPGGACPKRVATSRNHLQSLSLSPIQQGTMADEQRPYRPTLSILCKSMACQSQR